MTVCSNTKHQNDHPAPLIGLRGAKYYFPKERIELDYLLNTVLWKGPQGVFTSGVGYVIIDLPKTAV